MTLLNQMIQAASGADIDEIAKRVGLTPAQVESAIAALGRAEPEPRDTVDQAADKAQLPHDAVAKVFEAIGGEDGLRRIVGGLSQGGGLAGAMSGLFGKD
ncbi:MAG: hypothetical protein ACTHMG_04345 [Sphingomonas sp.]